MFESGGCMSKVPGVELSELIDAAKSKMQPSSDIFLDAIANGQMEDAAILPMTTENIINTVDFGPLVGKDLRNAGMIAALNAISDIYAMGGIPKYAVILLQLANTLTSEEKEELLAGIYDACHMEKVSVVGGHTIYGAETVVGLSVIGEPYNGIVISKHNCRIGDSVMLSKAIGTGLVLRSYYHNLLDEEDYKEAIGTALKSNAIQKQLVVSPYIHAMTDITGFGLIGHLSEMLDDDMGAKIQVDAVPVLKGIASLNPLVMKSHQILANYEYASNRHYIHGHMDTMKALALFDPQTNGPLLICMDRKLVPEAQKQGYTCIGQITAGNDIILDESVSSAERFESNDESNLSG